MEVCFGEGRPVRKSIGRWDYAVWSDNYRFAPDTDLEGSSKEERTLDEGDRRGYGLKTGGSAREDRVTLFFGRAFF